MIDFFHQMVRGIDLLSGLVFAFCFLLFVLFFTLGVWSFRNRFLSSLCFLISCIAFLGIPVAMAYSSKFYFHKIQIIHDASRPLVYSDSFLIDVTFKNQGKFVLKHCLFSLSPKRKPHNFTNQVYDFLQPLQSWHFMLEQKIGVNESFSFSKVIPYTHRDDDFILNLDCR